MILNEGNFAKRQEGVEEALRIGGKGRRSEYMAVQGISIRICARGVMNELKLYAMTERY